jgi:peptidoglycan hydrolase-like amidase
MAQAVVSRSYYTAGHGRHAGFDFCDTTHCQFLREPPPAQSPAAIAAAHTRGLALFYRDAPLAAMFSASCGGRTRSLEDPPADGYPYFAVECPYCRRGPRVRCSYCDPKAPGAGHGFGLCQTGAKGMAAEGATFREILSRYFPNTSLAQAAAHLRAFE